MSSDSDDKICDHCNQPVSEANWMLHEAQCRRRNVICPQCQEPVLKENMEEHRKEAHEIESCELCRKKMEKRLLESHKDKECPRRPIVCPFCKLEHEFCQYSEHESMCGSRTDICEVCQQYVRLREMDDHMKAKHMQDLSGAATGKLPEVISPSYEKQPAMMNEYPGASSHMASAKSSLCSKDDVSQFNMPERHYCEWCKVPVQPSQIKKHQEECGHRPLSCSYCKLDISMKEFSQHELICGSRTDNCTHCNQRIMLKDMDKHVNSCPGIRESVETAPPRRKKVGRSAEANWAKKEETIQHTEGNLEFDKYVSDSEATIPCDICFDDIPYSRYTLHCENCKRTYDQKGARTVTQIYSSSNNGGNVTRTPPSSPVQGHYVNPHIYYGGQVPTSTAHQQFPPDIPGSQLGGSPDRSLNSDMEDQLPCEFCNETFPAARLQEHQLRCYGEQKFSLTTTILPTETSPVQIPCEYCGKSIDSTQLTNHQVACDKNPLVFHERERLRAGRHGDHTSTPKMERCKHCGDSFSSLALRNHMELCNQEDVGYNEMVTSEPFRGTAECSYCGNPCPVGTLDSHQDQCRFNNSTRNIRKSPVSFQPHYRKDYSVTVPTSDEQENSITSDIPCEYCRETFKFYEIYRHQEMCPANPRVTLSGPPPLIEDETDSDCIPCEYCAKPFPACTLHSHQVLCQNVGERST